MNRVREVPRSLGRKPGAKRRFNLLREETAARLPRQRRLSALGSFVLFTGIPLAGIWQIQSDLDPSLAKARISAQGLGLNESESAPSNSFNDMQSSFCGFSTASRERGAEPEGKPLAPLIGVEPGQEEVQGIGKMQSPAGADLPKEERPKGRAEAHRTPPGQTQEQAFYRKAQAYHKQKNFEMAAEMYRRVLQENPAHRDALFHLSSIHMERSSYAEAYPLVLELVRRDPKDPRSLVNLAIAEIGLGRPEKAIAHLDRALTLEDPPRFKICYHRGIALSRLQRLEEAMLWYEESEDFDPGHAHLLFNMAVTFDKLERYDEAVAYYNRFLTAGDSSSRRERRDVESRIGVLTAYLAEKSRPPVGQSAHRVTESAR